MNGSQNFKYKYILKGAIKAIAIWFYVSRITQICMVTRVACKKYEYHHFIIVNGFCLWIISQLVEKGANSSFPGSLQNHFVFDYLMRTFDDYTKPHDTTAIHFRSSRLDHMCRSGV